MKLIDLSHPLFDSMPSYPGSESPVFETVATVSHEGHAEKRIPRFSHTGTHLDAPSHILSRCLTLDLAPVDQFAGSASALDFSSDSRRTIDIDDLMPYRYLILTSNLRINPYRLEQAWGTGCIQYRISGIDPEMPRTGFSFFAVPLRIPGDNGSPARAIAMISG